MSFVILRKRDSTEELVDVDNGNVIMSLVRREHTGPMVATVEHLNRIPPAAVVADKYGPAGRRWYAEHPEPSRPFREVQYVRTGERSKGRPVFEER